MTKIPLNRSILVLLLLCGFLPSSAQFRRQQSEKVIYQDLEKASEKLFLEAKNHYDATRYWEAARDLIILLDFHPSYSRIDQSLLILGDCLYEIGLTEGASKLYRHLVRKYIRSPFLPNALLGLQRIEYDRGDYSKCLEYYTVINRGNPKREILDGARYYAGLCHHKLKDYVQAVKILQEISDKSAYYPYGLYTIGLSHLRLKQVREALQAFAAVKRLAITNDVIRGAVDETHLTMGYIYYELKYHHHAVREFTAVSRDHKSYTNALLAAGWSAAQLGEWLQAVQYLTELAAIAPESDLAEEAFFLLGRAYLKLGRYEEARNVYDHLIAIFPERDVVPQMVQQVQVALMEESLKIEKVKLDLLMLETKLLDTIALPADEKVPTHIREEKKRLQETREGLLNRIREERRTFNQLSDLMADIRDRTDTRRERRDWRVYAEYGRARASFLLRIQESETKVQNQTPDSAPTGQTEKSDNSF
ncbi:tetratricopeptide repeat protein [candidate division KSB1 bacterium]|nr:tetratricopeptide repeat protein [candidate division KSB1 bacterium]